MAPPLSRHSVEQHAYEAGRHSAVELAWPKPFGFANQRRFRGCCQRDGLDREYHQHGSQNEEYVSRDVNERSDRLADRKPTHRDDHVNRESPPPHLWRGRIIGP